jgi:HK97 family phage portal protein
MTQKAKRSLLDSVASATLGAIGKALAPYISKSLSPADNRGGWYPLIRESYGGAWQQNETIELEDTLQYWAVFRCVSIIASDIAKMRVGLVEKTRNGLWEQTSAPAFSPVLRKPNNHQTRIQFYQNWMESKLTRGNTYVLKKRDARGVVIALYILDPNKVTPLVSDSGEVFYELLRDNIGSVPRERIIVPASEVIHDRWNTLYHPLVGLSPIYACGVNALTALRAERTSSRLFENGARPGGVLTAPGAISDSTATRLKEYFEDNFTGTNIGKVAVLGDGLQYAQMAMTAVDAQLIAQLQWNDAVIAGVFGVPSYMINAGTAPAYNNVEALNQQYYSQCLQVHIESIELCLDEGLGLNSPGGRAYGVQFDLEDLLRMDTATKVKTLVDGLKGIYTPNEARRKLHLGPVEGGDAVYLQQQNYSTEALAKRDEKEDPFGGASSTPAQEEADPADEPAPDDEEKGLSLADFIELRKKVMEGAEHAAA